MLIRKIAKRVYSNFLRTRIRWEKSKDLSSVQRLDRYLQAMDPNCADVMVRESYRSIHACRELNGSAEHWSKRIGETKRSKVLFILGSGPSINEITSKQWAHIETQDSWGFNYWFLHDFVPKTYFWQVDGEPGLDDVMANLCRLRGEAIAQSEIFIRGDSVNKRTFRGSALDRALNAIVGRPFVALPEIYIPSAVKAAPDDLIELFAKEGLMDLQRSAGVPKLASTVGFLLPLAIMLGYEKVVLCGIDMRDNGHFFDGPEYLAKYPPLPKVIEASFGQGVAHPHLQSDKRPYSVKDLILSLARYGERTQGTKVFVPNTSSGLYPEIPVYPWANGDV